MKKSNLSALAIIVSSAIASQAFADTTDTSHFSPVIVKATKTDKELSEIPQSVAVATEKTIKNQQATDISEVLDRLPGVSADGGLYGGVSVRGGSRGQVIVNVDGVNETLDSNKGMSINPLSIDPLLVEQVEVIKGGGSALYGSGGIGGVIAVRTKGVDDLLKDGENIGGFVRSRLDSGDDAFHNGFGVYGRTDDHKYDFLITADGFDSELNEHEPAKKTDDYVRNFASKFGMNIDENQRLQLNLKHSYSKFASDVVDPDRVQRDTAQVTHEIQLGDNVNLKSSVSYTSLKRDASMTNPMAGHQESSVNRLQFDTQNTHYLELGPTSHEITYGLSALNTKQRGTVDGKRDNFANANGERKEYGGFIQDTIDWEMFTLTGALRYVDYNMKGDGSSAVDTQKVLPSIGATIRATDWLNLYANYSHDFRAPSIDEMYTEIHYPMMNMAVVPNPDLKPESSVNKEFGFGLHKDGLVVENDRAFMRATYFTQDVKDMIEASRTPTMNPATGLVEYTMINVAEANRSGAEVELGYSVNNFTFATGTDYLKVKDKKSKKTKRHAKNFDASASYHFNKQNVDVTWLTSAATSSKISGQKTPGYMVHGLRTSIDVNGLELSAGVRNIFDKEYVNEYGGKGRERTYMIGAAYKF